MKIRVRLQRWVDRKTREIQTLNEGMKRIIGLSKKPGMTIGEFNRLVDKDRAE